jgi:murein DD-endopeptidase MepM/ murein hydrolase activator NlpD
VAPNRRCALVALGTVALVCIRGPSAWAATAPPVGQWVWPVSGPVLRGFDPPPTPFSPGHRGIDIGAAYGTPVVAPADGVVSFAGPVGGSLFVTIDHPDGYRSTSSFLSQVLVKKGQTVSAGQVVASSGRGHPELPTPQLHFGVRLNTVYVDPLPLLQPQSVVDLIRLAPLDPSTARSWSPAEGRARVERRPADRAGPIAAALGGELAAGVQAVARAVLRARGPPHGPIQ